jgi:hypothetical protein
MYVRRSRVIGDSFSEFRHIESRKSKVCIALLAHDKDVCVVCCNLGELSYKLGPVHKKHDIATTNIDVIVTRN